MGEDDRKRRDDIFDFIVDYKRDCRGVSPTYVEIGEHFNIAPDTARTHVFWLMVDGKIERVGRSYTVPLSEWELIT